MTLPPPSFPFPPQFPLVIAGSEEHALGVARSLLEDEEVAQSVADFDDHFDDVGKDWRNTTT